MLCPRSFLFLTLSPLSIIINKKMKRGAEKTLRIGGVLWVGLVVLLGFCWLFIGGGGWAEWHEGFLRVQQKGLEGDQQATCQFCYFLDVPQTFFASWSFSTCCVLPAPLMTFVTFWSYFSYQSNMAL